MLYEIKSRFDARVLFSLECGSLRLCVEAAVKARANLADAYLAGANLADAYLAGANLARAYLAGANLADANLADADLAGADGVIAAGQPDGWHAFGWLRERVIQVRVGCKSLSLAEGREYWSGKDNCREVLAALDYIQTIAKIRNWEVK